jgi:hypothetical protein
MALNKISVCWHGLSFNLLHLGSSIYGDGKILVFWNLSEFSRGPLPHHYHRTALRPTRIVSGGDAKKYYLPLAFLSITKILLS